MSRLFATASVLVALVVTACGEAEAPRSAAPTVAAPDRAIAGWSAPPPVDGTRVARLSEGFRSGAALRRWGYLEGDGERNRFRVRQGRLEVLPARAQWRDAQRAFYLYRAVRGDFDARVRLSAAGPAGLLVRSAPRADGDPENWVALRTSGWASTQASQTRDGATRPRDGWTQLRIVRRDSRFALLRRRHGGWRRVGAVVRADLPRTLQVGVAAAGPGRARVDAVRFVR